MMRQKRSHELPLKPWAKERLEKEKILLETYGLNRKKEIWRAEAILRNWQVRARDLRALKNQEKEKILLDKLVKLGLLREGAGLEDVLQLKVENILERRLQTIALRKGFARTLKQSRQFIVHGHLTLDGRKAKWPSTIVALHEEGKLAFHPRSKAKAALEWAGGQAPKTARTSSAEPSQPAKPEQKSTEQKPEGK